MLQSLLSKGYFPEELPPIFVSNSFGQYISQNRQIIERYNKESIPLSFILPTHHKSKRRLMIPNPFNQAKLSLCLENNWQSIKNHYDISNISFSKPMPRKRAFAAQHNYKSFTKQVLLNSYASRYLIKTDISGYYNNIYTHSIPWAIHGKDVAKRNRSNDLYGNEIDTLIRKSMYSQTKGIPIGPDSSLIISEIIGCKIDEILQDSDIEGFRYIDDYFLFFNNYSDAEKGMSIITRAFHEYELLVNHKKTKIIDQNYLITNELYNEWVVELRIFDTHNPKETDIVGLFSKAFSFHKKTSSNVLKYAVKQVKGINFNSNNYDICETFILKTCIEEPGIIPDVFDFFLDNFDKRNNDKIQKTFNELIVYHSSCLNFFEIIWSIYILCELSIEIEENAVNAIVELSDPLVALVALYYREKGLINITDAQSSIWKRLLNKENLYNENWLLAYEAYLRGWLSPSDRNFLNGTLFRKLKNNDISFMINEQDEEIIPEDSDEDDEGIFDY